MLGISYKPTLKRCLIQIRCVLNSNFFMQLVFHHFPVVFFKSIVESQVFKTLSWLGTVVLFKLYCLFLPFLKCHTIIILNKWLPKSKILKSLVSCRDSLIFRGVKHAFGPEALRSFYFESSHCSNLIISEYFFYICYRIFEFLFSWVERS